MNSFIIKLEKHSRKFTAIIVAGLTKYYLQDLSNNLNRKCSLFSKKKENCNRQRRINKRKDKKNEYFNENL